MRFLQWVRVPANAIGGPRGGGPPVRTIPPMRRSVVAAVAAIAFAGCGGGDATEAGTPNEIELPAPAGTEAGRAVATRAACLACHRLGSEGNDGPGQDLTHVGARLDRAGLERVLREPPKSMPSFASLPREDFDALVDYLAALR